jgi:hypothetical protein
VGNVCLLYDTDNNGKIDVKACHRKRYDGFIRESETDSCTYNMDGIRCTVPYTDSGYEYIAFKYPYIYYVDIDGDEKIDVIFVDVMEEGNIEEFRNSPELLSKGQKQYLCPKYCK